MLSNLGWIDRGSIWRYDGRTGIHDSVTIGDASYLRLRRGGRAEFFAAFHGLDGRCAISIHRWDSITTPVARCDIGGSRPRVTGDLAAFEGSPRYYVTYLDDEAASVAGYYLIEVGRGGVSVRPLDWFDAKSYDLGYQSVVSVLELPDGSLLFGVQRSSDLVLCDPVDLSVIRNVPLAGGQGNPSPFLRKNGSEVWAVDYDTLVMLDSETLTVRDAWLGHGSTDGSRMFLGDVWMGDSETELVVARPGSGDVVAIDPESLQLVRTWRTGRRPLTAALLQGDLVARDWHTGELLSPGG